MFPRYCKIIVGLALGLALLVAACATAPYTGRRRAAAANRPDYHWEFVVLENPQETRAFCFPGGQTGIFTGALKYTRDEAGLATVLAHEMGHAIARHNGERPRQAT